ncbi:hypothetical protein [Streptomyces sp. NBC_01306]|uniref:hypothetical protein n=1 Tax=Streptomyces sp. NBC_01306 TaxID=2903819 RepID=UPI002253155F|nr:hypothetical protein [Streptomyces sp. NBC_01306]MCX4726863.1 hypothetical protein [Streptomyces sp. NBC_01306]
MTYEQSRQDRQERSEAAPGQTGTSGPDVRVPDVRGDGLEAGTADGHEEEPVPDSVAEAGADPAADVRGTGFETEAAGRAHHRPR